MTSPRRYEGVKLLGVGCSCREGRAAGWGLTTEGVKLSDKPEEVSWFGQEGGMTGRGHRPRRCAAGWTEGGEIVSTLITVPEPAQ